MLVNLFAAAAPQLVAVTPVPLAKISAQEIERIRRALNAAGLLDGTGRAQGGVAECISKNT